MDPDIEKAKAAKPLERFIPKPKLKLLDQVSEVMRLLELLDPCSQLTEEFSD